MIETSLGHMILVIALCIFTVALMAAPIVQRVENGHWGPAKFGDDTFYWKTVGFIMAFFAVAGLASALLYMFLNLAWTLVSILFTIPVTIS